MGKKNNLFSNNNLVNKDLGLIEKSGDYSFKHDQSEEEGKEGKYDPGSMDIVA